MSRAVVGPVTVRDMVRDLQSGHIDERLKAKIGGLLAATVEEFADELDARLAVRKAARR
jgi:hypothetical protein